LQEKVVAKVARSLEEVKGIAAVWRAWQCHPNSDLDFYLTVLRSRPEILRPHVMIVYRDGCPEALLVGRLELRKLQASVGYAGLLKKETRALTFLYGGLLGTLSPEGSEVLVRDIMSSLSQGDADLAYFNHLMADSPLCRAATKVPGLLSRDYLPHHQVHHAMTMPGSLEEFYLRLSPEWRKTLKRYARKLLRENSGNVSVRYFRGIADLDILVKDSEGIAKRTYHRGLGVGFSDTPEMRRRLSLGAERGWLRGYVLYVQSVPWAFFLGTLYRGTFHGDFMGYDPLHAKYSPGMYLMTKVIEDLCNGKGREEKVSLIDFGLGDAHYKEVLGDLEWNDASVYIFAPTLKGAGLNVLRIPALLVDRILRRGLERTNLLAKIKRIWRGHLSKVQGDENSVTDERSRPAAN
jgi:hypothetical protein